MEAKEILFKKLDEHDINYDTHYIDDNDRAFDAIEEAMIEYHQQQVNSVDLADAVGRSEQSCKHPDSCAMGYYHQIGDYYCSKCQKTGLQD
jgi:hypothetical protein